VTQEMFASPLNCYFSTYCSAFLDTDVYFGSCGSFFDYEPIEGSFQCNPPFTEEVIERMADRIEILLASTELPLSFIVFIPEWLDPPTPGLVKMNKSAFKTCDIIVSGKKHKYVAGTQFLEHRGPLLYAAVHDTHVFFLQNKAGFEKWTPSEDKVEKLKNLMIKDDYKRKFDYESEQSGDLRDVLASKRQKIV
jgi:phosphorylated CTD-interacting factor 1